MQTPGELNTQTSAPLQGLTPQIRIEFRREIGQEVARDVKQLVLSSLWQRQWSDRLAEEIFEWRYCALNGGEMTLAYHDDRLVGMIASYTRPHVHADRLVCVREPADWFCLPEYRPLGVGVRLMCTLMDMNEPLLAIGGNENAMSVLPALAWQRFADVANYMLPLTTKPFVSKACRILHLRRIASTITKFSGLPVPFSRYRHARNRPRSRLDLTYVLPEIPAVDNGYDFLPLMADHEMEWLRDAPRELGAFYCLSFSVENEVSGSALIRIFPYRGLRYSKLIHVQASSPSVEAYTGLLAETIRYLRDEKVDLVQCRASSRFFRLALKNVGFLETGLTPAYWWSNHGRLLGGNFHLTFLRGDDAIRPYPE